MTLRNVFFVVCLFFVSIGHTAAESIDGSIPRPTLDEKLQNFRSDLIKHFSEGNLEGIISLCESDAVVTWQDGTIVEGVEGLKNYYQEKMLGENSPVNKIEFNPQIQSRQIEGNQIISHGKMGDTFHLKMFDSPLEFNSVFTAVLVDKGDSLKLRAAHVSLNAFDNAILKANEIKSMTVTIGGALLSLVIGLFLGRMLKKKA